MGWWSEQVVPRATDRMLDAPAVHALRERACEGLTGEVVEIGFGSGLNAPHYPPSVERVAAVDPSTVGWDLALRKRLSGVEAAVVRAGLDGERLQLADRSCDSALSTFTLCTIPHPDRALREVARVLRPGGQLHFLEHGLDPKPRVAAWQRRLTPIQRRFAAGCHLDRPIAELVTASGLVIERVETFYVAFPRAFGHAYLGVARKT